MSFFFSLVVFVVGQAILAVLRPGQLLNSSAKEHARIATMTIVQPDVRRLTPASSPSVQSTVPGHPEMMIAASTRSAMPLASSQPREWGIISR